jgi:uncharacterized caspase-like protein
MECTLLGRSREEESTVTDHIRKTKDTTPKTEESEEEEAFESIEAFALYLKGSEEEGDLNSKQREDIERLKLIYSMERLLHAQNC